MLCKKVALGWFTNAIWGCKPEPPKISSDIPKQTLHNWVQSQRQGELTGADSREPVLRPRLRLARPARRHLNALWFDGQGLMMLAKRLAKGMVIKLMTSCYSS